MNTNTATTMSTYHQPRTASINAHLIIPLGFDALPDPSIPAERMIAALLDAQEDGARFTRTAAPYLSRFGGGGLVVEGYLAGVGTCLWLRLHSPDSTFEAHGEDIHVEECGGCVGSGSRNMTGPCESQHGTAAMGECCQGLDRPLHRADDGYTQTRCPERMFRGDHSHLRR